MPDDMDVGAAFGILWIFFWGAFAFIAFVVIISILRAILELTLGLFEKEDDKDD